MMVNDLLEKSRLYLVYERVEENRRYIETLLSDPDSRDELQRLIGQRLLFGTAGIRGSMGPGYGQMNDLVIIQTSQGLASYLKQQYSAEECSTRGVIIGYDARYNSDRFARLAASAFLQKDIAVKFCERIIPTPVVAFGVRKLACLAGVVVTASHNPKNDNGYKVYWSNGAQILSPHDKNIQRHIEIEDNLRPWSAAWVSDIKELMHNYRTFNLVHENLIQSYYQYLAKDIARNPSGEESSIKIAYTTMHGVGHEYLTRALQLAGFKEIFPVHQQQEPNPDFPTVKFPNPEEFGALDLAFETAEKCNANLVIANDPDADRCAAAIYLPVTKRRRLLTGNELGAILGWWVWHTKRDPKKKSDKYFMLSTAVSSRFLQSMADSEGFNFVETLTGFKYMGNEAEKLLLASPENEVLFAYEEAIGYMVNSEVLDKDGITAAVQLAQCAAYLLNHHNRTLEDQIDWLHTKYGYHYCSNSYYLCYEKKTIDKIFKSLQENLPQNFGSQYQVTRVRDLNMGYDSSTADKKPTLPTSSGSYMITFFIGNGEITFTIRTSGTEPKIKYYSEIKGNLPEVGDHEKAKFKIRDRLDQFVRLAVERCLSPSHHNLKPAITK